MFLITLLYLRAVVVRIAWGANAGLRGGPEGLSSHSTIHSMCRHVFHALLDVIVGSFPDLNHVLGYSHAQEDLRKIGFTKTKTEVSKWDAGVAK